jgi:hypothetical protein
VDVERLCAALDAEAIASDPGMAPRVLLVYIAPGESGLVVHRVGRGTHVLSATGKRSEFKDRIMGALDALWPELSRQTRTWLRVGADMIAHSPVARMMGGAVDDED